MKKMNISIVLLLCVLMSCNKKTLPQESLALFADGKIAYQQGDLDYALETFLETEKVSPGFIEASVMAGKSYYFLQDYENGIEFLKKKWKKYPEWYEVGYWLGRCYTAQDSLDHAENIYTKLLTYNSQDFRVMHQLGLLKMDQGDYMKALEYFKKSLLQRNELAQVSLSLGQIYYSQDLLVEAVSTLETTISIGDKNSPITYAAKEILSEIK